MRIAERQRAIVQLVNERGNIPFADIQERFPHVSGMTLRRDLEALDKRNELVRIHGGAKSINQVVHPDDDLNSRIVRNVAKKQAIARKAVSLLSPDMSVYIDSGTTAVELCKAFPDERYLVYTHGVYCVLELSKLLKPEIHVVGGRLSRLSLSIVGSNAVYCLDNVNFNIVFLSAGGYSSNRGFTCNGEEESYLRKVVIQRAEKVVMLLDSTKFGVQHSYTLANLEDVDMLITDRGIDERILEEFHSHNIPILICDAE